MGYDLHSCLACKAWVGYGGGEKVVASICFECTAFMLKRVCIARGDSVDIGSDEDCFLCLKKETPCIWFPVICKSHKGATVPDNDVSVSDGDVSVPDGDVSGQGDDD